MPLRIPVSFTKEQLEQIAEELEVQAGRLREIAVKMEAHRVTEIGITNAKDLMRGIRQVGNFSQSAANSWLDLQMGGLLGDATTRRKKKE